MCLCKKDYLSFHKKTYTLKKRLKIITLSSVLLVILYFFLLSDFNPIFKNDEFVFINKEVKNAQNEDLKVIIDIHSKIYEKIEEPDCPCQTVANNIRINGRSTSLTKRTLYLLKINNEFSHNECLKFVLIHYDFGFENIGIKAASKFYFKKELERLNEKEVITLIAMLKNPVLYNPVRNKERLEKRVRMLQEILCKQKK